MVFLPKGKHTRDAEGRYHFFPCQGMPALFPLPQRAAHQGKVT
jgi:hypothetical protein